MWLFIQPNDTLFFRDGRPFDAGADVWTGILFPPYPPTCYGMLRTLLVHLVSRHVDYDAFFSNLPEKFKDFLGDASNPGTLFIKGPFLGEKKADGIHLSITSPADLWKLEDENKKNKWYLLQPVRNSLLTACSDLELPFHPLGFFHGIDSSKLKPREGVIGWNDLNYYLAGEPDHGELKYLPAEEDIFWQEESSTIIKRDDTTLTAQEHHLAHPSRIRMQADTDRFREKGLLIHVGGLDNQEDFDMDEIASLFQSLHTARLGGECRTCLIERLPVINLPVQEMINRISDTGRFRVILTSPAYFPGRGYYPDFLESTNGALPEGEWEIGGQKKKMRLVSMATGKRLSRIGGWDLARGVPKKMIKAVPAGTVMFFELPDFDKEQDKKWIKELVESSFPGTVPGGDGKYCKEGFNTMLIGGWDYVS
ncbi:MAG: type III-B CRISPR module-associated Cmr3 family protein [Pseudomonadota bacterium]